METILITGANRGIGLELVQQALQAGFNVLATYRGQPSDALRALTQSQRLELFELEVTDEAAIAQLSQQLKGRVIDVLVNNAGVLGDAHQDFGNIEKQPWLDTFAVNTIAPLMVSHALIENLKLAQHPRIITISSQMGALSRESTGMYAYRSSKAAVNKVMQVLALELKSESIIVCPVHPGWVKTDMGGEEADIEVGECASGILSVIQSLTIEQSGQFLTYQGEVHPW